MRLHPSKTALAVWAGFIVLWGLYWGILLLHHKKADAASVGVLMVLTVITATVWGVTKLTKLIARQRAALAREHAITQGQITAVADMINAILGDKTFQLPRGVRVVHTHTYSPIQDLDTKRSALALDLMEPTGEHRTVNR